MPKKKKSFILITLIIEKKYWKQCKKKSNGIKMNAILFAIMIIHSKNNEFILYSIYMILRNSYMGRSLTRFWFPYEKEEINEIFNNVMIRVRKKGIIIRNSLYFTTSIWFLETAKWSAVSPDFDFLLISEPASNNNFTI